MIYQNKMLLKAFPVYFILLSALSMPEHLHSQSIQEAYQNRLAQVLAWADTSSMENFLVAAAKIRNPATRKQGIQLFQSTLRRQDNAHRGMFVIYEMMIAYLAAQDQMPDSLKTAVRNYLAIANFYRGDTENHFTMYYTGLYLAAQTFPHLPASAWYTGKSSAENRKEAEGWLHEWMKLTTTIGQGEFDSPTYMIVFLAPMFGLYQWAEDPQMRERAQAMLYWLIADYAVDHLQGMYTGAHSRDYPEGIIKPKTSPMSAWGWLFFGQSSPKFHPTLLTAALGHFQLPELLYRIGTDRSQPYVHTETKRVRNVIRFGEKRNPPVYKYSYMTRHFALGSMQGGILQPIQQHTWDVTFVTDSPYASIFSVHPFMGEKDLGMFFPEEMKFALDEVARFHTYYGSEDKWPASSPYEQTFQHKNAIIVLYNIPPGAKFPHIDAFFPGDLDHRDIDPTGWIFCQAAQTYIAYFPLKPYQWLKDKDGYRLRSWELKNGCVVEVASSDDYATFDAFKQQIRANNLVFDQFDKNMMVSYTTSGGEVMTFSYDGPRLLNGVPVDFADYKLFHGPFLNAEIGSGKLSIRYQDQGLVLDLSRLDQAQILPEYGCRKIPRDIHLTGKLDDPLWQQARPVHLMDAITGRDGRFNTEVRALYTDKYLYIGFQCQDDYVWGTVTRRNGPIYDEECVEVFINPAGAAHQYYEINLSPKNVIFDACILNRRTPEKPHEKFTGLPEFDLADLHTAVQVRGKVDAPGKAKGWSAELAIPFAELIGARHLPPRPGDIWRINFYRIDSPQKGQREHYAWSKTGRAAFHLPWKFGYLRFYSSN
ncbi:MAG: hypothetical protein D6814_02260 [Calditrichaeota bacterium]|nr:MAG: hypothetical protein D6814_02260 [Calditrichota bacterium]